jgi:hypothetical protein
MKTIHRISVCLALFIIALALPIPLRAQTAFHPAMTITTGIADTVPFTTNAASRLNVEFDFGTVAGSYTTCTVQAYTTINGTSYLTIGTARSVTVSTSGIQAWAVDAGTSASVSSTASQSFGTLSFLELVCSGGYGTSAPVTVSITPSAIAISSGGGSGGDVNVHDGAGNSIGSTTGALNVTATLSPSASQIVKTAIGFPQGAVAVWGLTSSGSAITLNSPVVTGGRDTNGFARTALMSPIGATVVDVSATPVTISAPSGSIASGAIASGAVASGAYASGAFASGSISDGADVTLGAKADAKSTATDTTSITIMSVLKEISAMEQAPASRAVTSTALVSDADDASIAAAQTTALNLTLGYVYTGSAWVRPTGITQGSVITTGNPAPFVGAIGYYSDTGQPMKSTDVALVLGNLASNGAAAATNRLPVLPAISRTNLPSAFTAGRDVAMSVDNVTSAAWTTNIPAGLTTYVAVGSGTLASTPTDIATLSGNATNTVIVTGVEVTCTQTTSGINDIFLTKHSAADTGGTSIAMTTIPLDSGNAAAVSAPLWYTANPTVGTTLGAVDRAKLAFLTTTTAAPADIYIWRPTMGQSVVLRGTAQQLGINLNGATTGGAACNVTFRWIETTGL